MKPQHEEYIFLNKELIDLVDILSKTKSERVYNLLYRQFEKLNEEYISLCKELGVASHEYKVKRLVNE